MNDSREKRQFPRFQIPVVIDSLDLSDVPLVPREVSAGGFRVVASKRPELGSSIFYSIQIIDEVFEDCLAQVVWSQESGRDPLTWVIGVNVENMEGESGRLASVLKDLAAKGEGPSFPIKY